MREYGEEPFAWAIAGGWCASGRSSPLPPPLQLAGAVAAAVPPAVRRKDKNPARRTFQALRIAVNGELDALSEGLEEIFELLSPGGRLAVITFHSLEDRLVKNRFRQWATACTCPPEYPVCVRGQGEGKAGEQKSPSRPAAASWKKTAAAARPAAGAGEALRRRRPPG